MPQVAVFEVQDRLIERAANADTLTAVAQRAGILSGDENSSKIVSASESLDILHQYDQLAGSELGNGTVG